MSILTKTEICDNTPVSLPPLTFQALIGDMKRIESLSNEKLMDLESRLQAAEDEVKKRREENDKLRSELAAKERDSKLYYNQYQTIAEQFEVFKAKSCKVKDQFQPFDPEKMEADIEPAIVVFDTDSEKEDNSEETILFTSPELFLEPATPETPIPKANSTAIPTTIQSEQAKTNAVQLSEATTNLNAMETPVTKNTVVDATTAEKTSKEEGKKCPVVNTRKRARSESITKSGVPAKKARKMITAPTDFRCRNCPEKRFQKITEYREHIRQTHPERKFLCDFCPCACTKAYELNNHMNRVHTTDYNMGYDCKLCAVSFSTKRILGHHIHIYH